MAADSPSVASGLQPGGAGFSVLSAQRRRFAPPPEGATLSDEEKQADGRDFVRHRFQGWRPDGDGQEQTQGAGPAVPVGSQLTDEYLWQVRLDDGSWQDVLESWNVALTAAVRDGLPLLCLVRPWNARGSKVVHEQYYIDCRHPRWITQESVRTGRRRALRMVQAVRPIGTYVWPPPPPPYPPPALASVSAGPAAQAIIL